MVGAFAAEEDDGGGDVFGCLPARRRGVVSSCWRLMPSKVWVPKRSENQRVPMKPGQTALTRMTGASERASDSVIVFKAPLEAA